MSKKILYLLSLLLVLSFLLAACKFEANALPYVPDASLDADTLDDANGDGSDGGLDSMDAAADAAGPDAPAVVGCTITCTDLQTTNDGLLSWVLHVQGPFRNSLCVAETSIPTPVKIRIAGDFNNWNPQARDERAYQGEDVVHDIPVPQQNAGRFNLLLDTAWFDLSGNCEPDPTPVHCTVLDGSANTNCHLTTNGGAILL